MDEQTNRSLKVARLQRLGVHATVVLVAFVLGFVPMWLVARTRAR